MHKKILSVSLKQKKSKNWKDAAVGWHNWEVRIELHDGREILRSMSGIYEDVKRNCEENDPEEE